MVSSVAFLRTSHNARTFTSGGFLLLSSYPRPMLAVVAPGCVLHGVHVGGEVRGLPNVAGCAVTRTQCVAPAQPGATS